MKQLELLAPARDIQVGIAAIDCGADAVYIAGPQFGARQAAGNTIEDIRQLCSYAHQFGVRIFVALNTILYDDELEAAYRQMIEVQDAGADALIIQDMAVLEMARKGIGNLKEEIRIPLHASTQCAIRTPEQAVFLESLGFSRLILERQLSLEQIKAIRNAVNCELEFFVHGALCVGYSGQCYLSEKIAGRSANRGACIQACRSRYDLADASGKILVKDKALLSLKDYNLKSRIEDLADAGISSFKIEGRLKNISYVKNVVREYSITLEDLISRNPDKYERGSFGKVTGGFIPDSAKTFNRGYTELFIDGKRGRWASMDAAKAMGEEIGTISNLNRDKSVITVSLTGKNISLNNGDGFSFVAKDGDVTGFRGDVCEGNTIRCKNIQSAYIGARLYRNINAAFEKEIDRLGCKREITVAASMNFKNIDGRWMLQATAISEDGREIFKEYDAGDQLASNPARMADMIRNQINKTTGHYRFIYNGEDACPLPFMSASFLNGIRRDLAESLDSKPCNAKRLINKQLTGYGEYTSTAAEYDSNISNHISKSLYERCGVKKAEPAYELSHKSDAKLIRTKYCIRYELGICPKHHGCKESGPLFLLNNGMRLSLHFDCRNCEMTVKEA